jgi:hypothetical protein
VHQRDDADHQHEAGHGDVPAITAISGATISALISLDSTVWVSDSGSDFGTGCCGRGGRRYRAPRQ